MHIPTATLLCMDLSAFLGIALFLGLLIAAKKRSGSLRPFLFGCASFIVFALVLESIVHQVVLTSAVGQTILNNIWLYGLYGGLMAGLFEETGRLVTMKLLKKRHPGRETALAYGAGHGGIEVVITLVSTMMAYLVYAILINAGQIEQLMAPMDEANREAMLAVFTQLETAPPASALLGVVERICAVIFHISMSVLVWKAVEGKTSMYFLAIFLHAAFDMAAVILSSSGMNTLLLEGILLVMSLLAAFGARKVYAQMRAQVS